MTVVKILLVTILVTVAVAAGVMWAVDRSTQHELPPAPTPTPFTTTLPGGHS